jgi:hypothetical protein
MGIMRPLAAAFVALVVAVAVAGCGGDETSDTSRVLVYLLRGEQVGAAARQVSAVDGTEEERTADLARAAVEQLLEGPTEAEDEAGLGTVIPEGTELLDLSMSDVGRTRGLATVDLSGEFDDGGGSASMFARLAQVVFTLTQFDGVRAVDFELDGEPVTTFSAEGIELDRPQTRADFEDQTPAILVEDPAVGDVVSSPMRLAGTANTFEANFQYEVVAPDGEKLAGTFVTATCGTGCRGTFDERVTFDADGGDEVTLVVFEPSAKDGSRTKQVDVPLETG